MQAGELILRMIMWLITTGVCTENYYEKWLQQEFNSLVGVFSKNTVKYVNEGKFPCLKSFLKNNRNPVLP